jgi:hypothetical protein
MKQSILIISFSLLANILWSSCKYNQTEDPEKITFVLSDTMLKNIRIDTAHVLPVMNGLHVPGKVMPDDDRQIAVPSAAVIFDNNKHYVLVFKDKFNIAVRQVEVAKTVGDITYLSSGLKADEKVISKNQLLIYNALAKTQSSKGAKDY